MRGTQFAGTDAGELSMLVSGPTHLTRLGAGKARPFNAVSTSHRCLASRGGLAYTGIARRSHMLEGCLFPALGRRLCVTKAVQTEQSQTKRQPRCSPLHYNVEEFCKKIVPTEKEAEEKLMIIEGIKNCTKKAFELSKRVEVQTFGSFATNLACWNSDIDIVITGLLEPDRISGGYNLKERRQVGVFLDRLAAQLRRHKKLEVRKMQLVRHARIPIIKFLTKTNVTVDISISDESGPRAARYMLQQTRVYPPLRPIVLVLKTYLKQLGLNEVNTGGLSSYSLTNMVIAHLQEELKSNHDIHDLGETLYSFLCRYGEEFDYTNDAVSVASGGIVPKSSLGFALDSSRMGSYGDNNVPYHERLCVDDPLTGRDVSAGTYRIDVVRDSFFRATRKLEQIAKGRKITDTSINYLLAMFDTQKVCQRSYSLDDKDFIVVGQRRSPSFDEEDEVEPLQSDD